MCEKGKSCKNSLIYKAFCRGIASEEEIFERFINQWFCFVRRQSRNVHTKNKRKSQNAITPRKQKPFSWLTQSDCNDNLSNAILNRTTKSDLFDSLMKRCKFR